MSGSGLGSGSGSGFRSGSSVGPGSNSAIRGLDKPTTSFPTSSSTSLLPLLPSSSSSSPSSPSFNGPSGSFEKDERGGWRRASAGSVGLREWGKKEEVGLDDEGQVLKNNKKEADVSMQLGRDNERDNEEILLEGPDELVVVSPSPVKTEDKDGPVSPTPMDLVSTGTLEAIPIPPSNLATATTTPDVTEHVSSSPKPQNQESIQPPTQLAPNVTQDPVERPSISEIQDKEVGTDQAKSDQEKGSDLKLDDQSEPTMIGIGQPQREAIELQTSLGSDQVERGDEMEEAKDVGSVGLDANVGETKKEVEVEVEPKDVKLPETPVREDAVQDETHIQGDVEVEPLQRGEQEVVNHKQELDGSPKFDQKQEKGVQAVVEDTESPSIPASSSSLTTSPAKIPSPNQQSKKPVAKSQSKSGKPAQTNTTTPLRQQKTGGGLPLPKPSTPIVRVTKGSAPPSSYNRSPPASTSTKAETKPSTPSNQNRIARKSLSSSQTSATPLRPSHTGSPSTVSSSTVTPLRPHHTGSVTPLRPQATGTRAIERSPLYAPTASSLAKTKQKVTSTSPGSAGMKSKTGSIGRASGGRKESVGSGSEAGMSGGSPAMRSRVISNGSAASSGIARQRMGSEE